MKINSYQILKKKELLKARLFSNTFRFIDGLYAINDNLEFDRNSENIYSSELQLKKENNSTSEISFLDLYVIIEDKKFKTQLYDKRDAFPFCIVHMSQMDSNTQ